MTACVLFAVTCLAAISPCSCACSEKCTAEYLSAAMYMASTFTEYATHVLSPVYAVIASGWDTAVIQRKIIWMCHIAEKYDSCMERCDDVRTGQLRTVLVGHLTSVCVSARNSRRAFVEYIRCEREHYEQAAKICSQPPKTENTLSTYCSQLHQYASCYWGMPFKCSDAAVTIRSRINDSLKRSYDVLETLLKRMNVPFKCVRAVDATVVSLNRTKLRRGQVRDLSQLHSSDEPLANNLCCPQLRFYGLLVVSPFILSAFYYFYSCCILYRLV